MNENYETIEEQIMRVVNEMAAAGELVTSVDENGETLYSLPENVKKSNDELFIKRSQAAHKAWATRRKLKASADAAYMDKVKFKVNKNSDELFIKRSQAAHKAWATRRKLQAAKTKNKNKKTCEVKHKPCKATKTAETSPYTVVYSAYVEYVQVFPCNKRALHSK